jgi:di/tricarboxylate transporter
VREGLVAIGSPLVGATAVTAQLRARHGLALLALGRRNPPPPRRLAFLRFEAGDVLVLKGAADRLADGMEALRVVPLSDRPVALGARRRSWGPAVVLGIAAALAAAGTVPVSVAFVGAAVATLMLDDGGVGPGAGATPDAGWRGVEWRTVAVLAALIPLADALVRSGAAGIAADAAARAGAGVPPLLLLAAVIGAAGLLASWTGSILAALVLAPVAAGGAARLDLSADAFLIAVALGAACGFLDPRGRAAAGLVWAPGGYSMSDYRRLGALLLATVAVVGALTIAAVWGTGGR